MFVRVRVPPNLSDIGKNRAVQDQCVRQADRESGSSLRPLPEKRDTYTGELPRLTREIKHLIEVFRSRDRVPANPKEGRLELDREKQ